MDISRLTQLQGSKWQGRGEIWLDPEGNQTQYYDCTLVIEKDQVQYTWEWEGNTQQGRYLFNSSGATWIDSWHQSTEAICKPSQDTDCLFSIINSYEVPSNPDWKWKSQLSQRPDLQLVLQMTNITPWGEDGRAVRMIFNKQ